MARRGIFRANASGLFHLVARARRLRAKSRTLRGAARCNSFSAARNSAAALQRKLAPRSSLSRNARLRRDARVRSAHCRHSILRALSAVRRSRHFHDDQPRTRACVRRRHHCAARSGEPRRAKSHPRAFCDKFQRRAGHHPSWRCDFLSAAALHRRIFLQLFRAPHPDDRIQRIRRTRPDRRNPEELAKW